jgi:hypothetical protein
MNRAVFLCAPPFGDLESYREARKVRSYFGSEGEHESQARAAWASEKGGQEVRSRVRIQVGGLIAEMGVRRSWSRMAG